MGGRVLGEDRGRWSSFVDVKRLLAFAVDRREGGFGWFNVCVDSALDDDVWIRAGDELRVSPARAIHLIRDACAAVERN